MRLKELEIQGFKSFPDRTRLAIGDGITGVVGPNGSGKSNLSDAIRWVMGETSSRQLRGAGKMEDVIFGGTQTRGAMGYACVNLTIDNADHGLDVDADEVVIGRRYYRSGESEYSINGQSVRLKDVYELLLDTGLGRDGYAIVGQGRIAEIVAAKSAERREIFEEASGIARYRYRKNEAERRLAQTETNLVRLRDILGELESRVGPLKREGEKAQQFLRLSETRKSLEVTLWVDAIRRAQGAARDQLRRYEAAQADYERLGRELEQADRETQLLRDAAQELMLRVEQDNASIRALTEEGAADDSRLAVLDNENDHSRRQIAEAQAELDRAGQGRQALEEEAQAHRDAMQTLRQRLQEGEQTLQTLHRRLEELEQRARESGSQRQIAGAEQARWQDAATAARVRLASLESGAAADTARRAEAAAALAQARQQARDAEQRRDDAEKALQAARDAQRRSDNIKAGLELKLKSRQAQAQAAQKALQDAEREQAAAQQRQRLLQDLERSLDGYQQSVKAVMKAAGAKRLRGVIGPVAGVLTVRHGYELAIETALGYAVQNIVVENEAAARAAIAFLKAERAGRATFLPLDTVQGARFTGRLGGTAQLAADLVQADARYRSVVDNLLGRIIVVDDLAEASAVAKSLQYRNRIVTRDGQVINAGGSFTGGSTARGVGVFSRKQELEELAGRLTELSAAREAAAREAAARTAEAQTLTAELAGAQSESVNAASAALRAELELDRLGAQVQALEQDAAALQAEDAALESRLADNAQQAERARAGLAQAEQELAACGARLAALGEDDSALAKERQALGEQTSACRLERLAQEKDLALHEAALQTLAGRSGESEARARELDAAIEAARQRIAANDLRAADIRRARAEGQERIAACEEDIRTATQQRLEKEAGVTRLGQRSRALTDDRERMSGEMARLAERRAAAESELDATAAKLWEEYQLTGDEARALCVPFDSLTELRRQVTEVRGQIRALGHVNVGAIEEYREVRARYDTLKAQVTDVEQAKAELTRMIAELCDEMDALFRTNFRRINQNFSQIFRELFGGGSARLYLSDENDVLGSGIEIEVNPPGKVIRNLTALSGGEQALVAISIYFAILGVNPAPFCILDEIEAALDDVNVTRFAQFLRRMTQHTQFVVITHRRGTMEAADVLYGVTMQEDGVSKILRLDLNNVAAELIS